MVIQGYRVPRQNFSPKPRVYVSDDGEEFSARFPKKIYTIVTKKEMEEC